MKNTFFEKNFFVYFMKKIVSFFKKMTKSWFLGIGDHSSRWSC